MSSAHGNVRIAFNDKVSVQEAASILGCSVASIHNLRNSRRLITGQRIGREWYFDVTEINQAKSTNLITPRTRKPKDESKMTDSVAGAPSFKTEDSIKEIRISIERDQLERIKMALFACGTDPVNFLKGKLEELDQRILNQLSGLVSSSPGDSRSSAE